MREISKKKTHTISICTVYIVHHSNICGNCDEMWRVAASKQETGLEKVEETGLEKVEEAGKNVTLFTHTYIVQRERERETHTQKVPNATKMH